MRREASPSFTDLVLGMMIKQPLGAKWDLVLQGDVGFGGSNGTWNGMATFQRETQGGNFWTLGARVMGVDFDDVLPGGDLFVMDTTMAGLMVGFTWD